LTTQMKEYNGIAASPGIVMGKAFLYLDDTVMVPEYDITSEEVTGERTRFLCAVERAIEEIELLKTRLNEEMGVEESKFLESHILMLNDPEFRERVDRGLKIHQKNVEWVLLRVVDELLEKLGNVTDRYIRERTVDINDISRRVLNHLLYRDRLSLADIREEVILVTHDLLPSDILVMNKQMVKAIVMDVGGKTSHTAILARSFEIPAVLGLFDITRFVKTGDELIINGNTGTVIVKPDAATKERFVKYRRVWQRREDELLHVRNLPSETRDGKRVELKANIEMPQELPSVLSHGADGIGLFRSEFLFLHPGRMTSEEEQYTAYSKVLEALAGKPVTIRTLDLGGDKLSSDFSGVPEKNPILGWRAIRYCLANTEIFKTQLRALLRASVYGELRIMFPMISGVEELDRVLEVYEEVRFELDTSGVPYKPEIPIGIMIEVPSAALTSDILAKWVQFFSIGTNDLIQYTIAVDRGNEKTAYLYEPFHPGVLRLIRMVVENAHAQGIPVGMCGEMASDPLASVILLGLGLDEYSMSPSSIPEVKRILRSVSVPQARQLVETIMEMRASREIDEYVKEWMEERFDIYPYK
jgi:phosphotransferase system enzyme I (PtsI)